mgnify:FL=1
MVDASSTGHQGQHGHEFLEFEYSNGRLRYANNSKYVRPSLSLSGTGTGGRRVAAEVPTRRRGGSAAYAHAG